MDINISGVGNVTPGEYDHISISGCGRIEGPVRCAELQCSGSISGKGEIECAGAARFSGSVRLDGALRADSAAVSGSISCASVKARRDVSIAGSAKLDGGVSGGAVGISGSASIGGDVEGESVRISGSVTTPGLVNGETVEIRPARCSLGSVGGSRITVGDTDAVKLRRFLWFRKKNVLEVRDGIEGDDVYLEYTVCPQVSGKRVTVGRGCRIGEVRYSESCTVAPKARVQKLTKV